MRTRPIAIAAAAVLTGCVAMEPSVVEPAEFLGEHRNPADIYQAAGAPTLLPLFDLRFEPMERVALVNFGDDPVYAGIELQTFAAENGGESALALLWRNDGVVDVYMSPNHVMDEVRRRSLENLLNRITLQRADFDYRLEVTAHGLDAALRMVDREGRRVEFEVVETTGTPNLGSLIAPVGAVVERPRYLPLVFMDEFALVRRRGTRIEVTIDGERRTPDKMTRLVKGPASYFTRYSTRVVIANWNERREAALDPLPVTPAASEIAAGDLTYGLRWNAGHPEVESVVGRQGEDRVTFRFSPALPDLGALRNGARVEGRFVININGVEGITAGEFRAYREGDAAHIEIQPLRAWQPPILKGDPWVAGYTYRARVDLGAHPPRLSAEWRRRGE